MKNQLLGIHHVTAMTDDIERNYKFFTETLGMRLVKKTVNQDDIQTYHTFFADDLGTPGTDMTFFDFPDNPKGAHGTNSITRTGFRVPNDLALDYYKNRFEELDVKHDPIEVMFGKKTLAFEESDGQRYRLFSDELNTGIPAGTPWKDSPIPQDKVICGLGPIEITVSYFDDFKQILQEVYSMRLISEQPDMALFEIGAGGNGGQVILKKDTVSPQAWQGYGEVHHVAFRVESEKALDWWNDRYNELQIGNSGIVDRFYFKALYARIGHILIEISTDGPGFATDEPYETLGESLSLPPFLESKRPEIETAIRPFDTKRK